MSDISKCLGTNCLLKEQCYRYTAPVNHFWQSYLGDSPYNKETKTCDYFWINNRKPSIVLPQAN